MSYAQMIRDFFGTIFGSRFIWHLEAELLQLRLERDQLRAKCDRYEAVLMPLSSPGGAAYVRALNPPKPQLSPSSVAAPHTRSWSEVQAEWSRTLEDVESTEVSQ